MNNYPNGFKPALLESKPLAEPLELEIEITGLTYDTGYGDECADLYVTVQVLDTALNYEIISSGYNIIDNDGGIKKEIEDDIAKEHLQLFDEEVTKAAMRHL